ncbi:MAG: hypothetical protein M3492_07245, partial [Actinomycetota bacterium]|nr:hypothetical protein [Actinomycetota bacterium]
RLHSITEIDDLDLDAELADSVTVVEWGEGLVEHLSDEHLLIELTWASESADSLHNRHSESCDGPEAPGAEARSALLTAYGPRWRARLPSVTAP